VDHFAAFPMELPRRIVLGWSPPGVCTACGEGRRPVTVRAIGSYEGNVNRTRGDALTMGAGPDYDSCPSRANGVPKDITTTITGYACACTPFTDHPERRRGDNNPQSRDGISTLHGGEREWRERLASYPGPVREYHFDRWAPLPARPAVVLDPFMGTGTSLLAASALGRIGIGVDLSQDYCRLAQWRTADPAERAKAMQVPKPPPVPDGQEALWA
jgi:hypothetical protein